MIRYSQAPSDLKNTITDKDNKKTEAEEADVKDDDGTDAN